MAVAFSALATLPLAGLILLAAGHWLGGHGSFVQVRDALVAAVGVIASYFLAALTAGPVFALCRPIRSRIWGSIVTGGLVSAIIMAAIGAVIVWWWEPVGRVLFGDARTTRETMASLVRPVTLFSGMAGMIAGPVMRARLKSVAPAS